jgi:hypothetical protein
MRILGNVIGRWQVGHSSPAEPAWLTFSGSGCSLDSGTTFLLADTR